MSRRPAPISYPHTHYCYACQERPDCADRACTAPLYAVCPSCAALGWGEMGGKTARQLIRDYLAQTAGTVQECSYPDRCQRGRPHCTIDAHPADCYLAYESEHREWWHAVVREVALAAELPYPDDLRGAAEGARWNETLRAIVREERAAWWREPA
jgi:hypothetical protein